MGTDDVPTISENVTTTETVSMESNAPAAPESNSTTIPNPLAQGDQVSDQATGQVSDQVTDPVGEPASEPDAAPKNLTDVMYNSIGEATPEPEDTRTDFEKSIPDEYKDKGFVKKYSSMDQFLKAHESALNKLSERPEEIDFTNATQEQLDGFYSKMRPEDPSGYEFPEAAQDSEKEVLGKIFHESGLHPNQAKSVMEKYNNYVMETQAAEYSQETFDKSMAVAVGADFQGKLPELQGTIAKAMGQEVVQFIDKMPSALRAAFYGYANKMNDSFGASEAAVSAGTHDMGSVNWQAQKDQAQKDIDAMQSNPNHKQADLDAAKARWREAHINISKMKGNK